MILTDEETRHIVSITYRKRNENISSVLERLNSFFVNVKINGVRHVDRHVNWDLIWLQINNTEVFNVYWKNYEDLVKEYKLEGASGVSQIRPENYESVTNLILENLEEVKRDSSGNEILNILKKIHE